MRRRAGTLVSAIVTAAVVRAGPTTTPPTARDWPMWGGSPARNPVADAAHIPHEWDLKTKRNIRWSAALGTYTYGGPVVADGKVYVGTNNARSYRPDIAGDKGCLLCFDAATGRFLWQATHDKLPDGPAHDWPEQGVASTPCVVGDRLYYVSNRCELVCADADGFLDGRNDGPLRDEKHAGPQDADFIWILDMMGQLGVHPHNLAASSPVVVGDLVLVCTGNAVDDDHERPPAPHAPSFIAVDKRTGAVVWQRSDPGERILHGQWSSPAVGVVNGHPLAVFAGGDGWCYAFDALTGEPVWRFDLNPKDAVWEIGGTGTKSSIVATPVLVDKRVYLAVGDDPESARGPGHLYAIDATGKGDITATGRVWRVGGNDFGRTVASVALADGLLYAVDLPGYLSCFDAASGRRHWRYDMKAAVWSTPTVADGKVFLGNVDGELVVLAHGRELKELARHDMGAGIYATPAVAGGVLYVATKRTLYAIAPTDAATAPPAHPGPAATQPGDAPPTETHPTTAPTTTTAPHPTTAHAPPTQPAAPDRSDPLAEPGRASWPMFRGNPQLTGVAADHLPEKLSVRWKHETGAPLSATAAIVDGTVYVGTEGRKVLALDLADGARQWEFDTAGPVEASPTVVSVAETEARRLTLVVCGDEEGVLYALEAASGALRWKFTTDDRIVSSVTPLDGRLYFGSYDRRLYCLEARDGRPVWKYTTPERLHATPAVVGDHVLVPGCDARLHVVDRRDGSLVRRVALGAVTGCAPATRGATVFLGTYGEEVLGIDWQAGQVLWRFSDPQRRAPFMSSAAVTEQAVVVGGRDRRLRALDPRSGAPRWEFTAGGPIDSSPVIVDARVFVGSDDGNLYAVALSDGRELWRFEAGAPLAASPAVGADCLVIGTQDGLLYCFGAPRPRPP